MEVLHEGRDRPQDNGDLRFMTLEEIKDSVSMKDVLGRYGIKVGRNGMCCCPIHQEKHPSMKVYADGYKCFACNSSGDVFKFIQEMEGCDFKTAFKILGGTYKRESSKMARIAQTSRYEHKKQERQRAEQAEKDFRRILMGCIDLCQYWLCNREPFTDDWCYATNNLQWLWHVFEEKYIEGEKVNEIDVLRKYKQIRQRFITG